MYGVAGEKRPIFLESDAFSYNLDDPTFSWKYMTVGFGIILGFVDGVIHSFITSLPLAENIWQHGLTVVIFRMIHSMIKSRI